MRPFHRFVLRLLLVAGAVVVVAGSASAQAPEASLSGRVLDGAGRALEGVSVGIVELRRGALTDSTGRYAIPALPPGTYRVSFQRLGYAPVVRRITFAGGAATLDASLVESALELPGTQVTASAHATFALTSPQPVTVLEGDALRQARTATLGATLEKLAGMRNWSTGGGIGKPVIRGLRSDRVVVASEGLRVDQQGWGDEHGPQVESENVERVEVLRGPASVLYGSDALGGVVHVVPRELPTAIGEPAFVRGRLAGAFATGDDNREGTLAVEGASGNVGARASFTARKADDLATPEGPLFNSGHEAWTAGASAGVRGARGSLDASWTRRDERVEIHEDPAEDPEATPYQEIVDDLVRVRGLLPLGTSSRLEVNLGAGRNERSEFEGADDPAVALGLVERSAAAMARFHHPPLGQVEGLVGATWRTNRVTKFGEESLVPASRGRDAALFAFEQLEAGRWHFALGARYDHRLLDVDDDPALAVTGQQRSWNALSGNAGALFRLAGPVALAAHLGRGFRAPSSFDLFAFGVHEGTFSFQRGNPELDVETSLDAELSVRVQASSVRAEVSAFVNQIDGYITTRPSGELDPESGYEIFDTVQGDARLVGFEVSAEAHPLEVLHLDVTTDGVRGDDTERDVPLPWIPPWRALYGVRLEPAVDGAVSELFVGLRGESFAGASRLAPGETGTAGATLVHAEAGFTVPGSRPFTLDLAVRNLFDHAYRDFMSRSKAWALAPGRNVTLRLGLRF